jgi:NADPH2:quinone reductase
MRAIEITEPGGPGVLQQVERPDPVPAAGEVLIRVEAAGLNRADVMQRRGGYPPPAGASDIPGLEAAGTVIGGDTGASARFRAGDAVCALLAGGGYAELCVVPATQCLPVPAGLTFREAAVLPETHFTVWSNVFDRARLAPGESLLVQGGASGIGVAAIQVAAAFGHAVFATAGSAARCRAIEALGTRRAIAYHDEDFVAVVRAETAGRGVDVILDIVGGSYVAREIECLAPDGRLALIALQGGARAEVDLALLLRRRLTLIGSTLRPREAAFKSAIAAQLEARVWPLLAAGRIKPMLHASYPFASAGAAHELMESGAYIGKIALDVGARAGDRP